MCFCLKSDIINDSKHWHKKKSRHLLTETGKKKPDKKISLKVRCIIWIRVLNSKWTEKIILPPNTGEADCFSVYKQP